MRGGGSKAVWNFSENSCVLEGRGFPKTRGSNHLVKNSWYWPNVSIKRNDKLLTVGGGGLSLTVTDITHHEVEKFISQNSVAPLLITDLRGWLYKGHHNNKFPRSTIPSFVGNIWALIASILELTVIQRSEQYTVVFLPAFFTGGEAVKAQDESLLILTHSLFTPVQIRPLPNTPPVG